ADALAIGRILPKCAVTHSSAGRSGIRLEYPCLRREPLSDPRVKRFQLGLPTTHTSSSNWVHEAALPVRPEPSSFRGPSHDRDAVVNGGNGTSLEKEEYPLDRLTEDNGGRTVPTGDNGHTPTVKRWITVSTRPRGKNRARSARSEPRTQRTRGVSG